MNVGKRLLDLMASAIGIVLLLPVFAAIAVAVRFDSRGPVFYRGWRVGRFGKPFRIFKFRTMVANAESMGSSTTRADDPRITRLGRFLRRTKLDELPQLFNVLRGAMSLVGPRPQVQWVVDRYDAEQRQLLEVRPGITDYASIKFRHSGELLRGVSDPEAAYLRLIGPEKIRLGLYYVRHHSLWTDLVILWATFWSLLVDVDVRLPGDEPSRRGSAAYDR